jgi:SAM-dependent methyltransferase
MANVEKIKFVQNQPLLDKLEVRKYLLECKLFGANLHFIFRDSLRKNSPSPQMIKCSESLKLVVGKSCQYTCTLLCNADIYFLLFCSPGDFALILKDRYKDRIQVTAIEPADHDFKLAKEKSTGSDVDFQQSDIFKFESDSKFDLVIFTKSLHHCIPVDLVRGN